MSKLNELIDKIHAIPIHSVIEKYISLQKAGINYKAKCPFPEHDDKTPSFSVSVNKNIFKCFSCNLGGDAITFVQIYKNLKFYNAIEDICQKFNILIPDQKEFTPEQQEVYKKHEQLKIIYNAAAEYYNKNLFDPSSANARKYLLSRTNNEQIEKFELGYASKKWTGLLDHMKGKGFKTDTLLESKLINEKNGKLFDFFRDRIMIPICDPFGSVVAFSARILPGARDDQPKYINSPETPIFSKGHTLFGLNHARTAIQKKEGAYLVEGPFDLLRMASIGVENTVATSGTALTGDQISLLQRYTQNTVIVFDADENQSGAKAADHAGKMMVEAGMNCNVIMLPGGAGKADPDTFFTSADIFKKYKEENIKDYILWKASDLAATIKNYPDRKEKAITEISHLITRYENASRREVYIDECAKIIPQKKLWTKEVSVCLKENTNQSDKHKGATANIMTVAKQYLSENYTIRFNVVKCELENKDPETDQWEKLEENDVYVKLYENDCKISQAQLTAVLYSSFSEKHDPFLNYFENLPEWDSHDYISDLSSYIVFKSDDIKKRFLIQFKKWLVRIVKCSIEDRYFNKQAIILVGRKQNTGKSMFCRYLCPQVLSDYIQENIPIHDKDGLIALVTNFLINLDELSTLMRKEINELKSYFSQSTVKTRLPYDKRAKSYPRRVSFIGSTNMPEFLQDDSGSVRWLCFEIESINWKYSDEIDINQVYSQVWALYNDAAFDYEMTKDEIAENDNLNKYFSITKPEQELIRQYFIPSDEKNGFFFPSTQIREMLMKVNKSSEKIGSEKIGKALISLGFEKISKRNDGNPGYGYYIQATDDFLKEAVKQGTIDEMTDKMKEFITNSLNKNEQGNGKLVEPKIDNQEDLPF